MPFPASLQSPFAAPVNSNGQNPSTSGVHSKSHGSNPSRLNLYPECVETADPTPLPSGGLFIFPRPAIYSTMPDAHEQPHLPRNTLIPGSSLEVSSLEKDSPKSSTASISIVTSRSGTGDSSGLKDSVGTLLSIPPSSISATTPSSSETWEAGNDRARKKEKQKEKARKPSGLSLSRPASFVEEEGTSDGSLEPSSSRSSSAESEFRACPASEHLSVGYLPFNPGQIQLIQPQLTRQSQQPSPHVVTDEWNLSTPTATPTGTPRAFIRPLPISPTTASPRYSGSADRDIEKQREGDSETGRAHVHGQGHIRWRSPLRVERRESERYSNIRYDEQVEGRWESDSSNETTPLLGGQTPFTYTSAANHANGDSQLANKGISWNFSPTLPSRLRASAMDVKTIIKKELTQLPWHGLTAVRATPAVVLGCLLNILDGVSCEF
jgi:SulP family sulfate permease